MEWRNKILSAVIVAAFLCASFVGMTYFADDAEALDTPATSIATIRQGAAATVNDVAWAPDGSWGLAVGASGMVWELDDEEMSSTGAAFDAFTAQSNAGDTWYGLAWNVTLGGFMIVGDGIGNAGDNIYTYDQAGGLQAWGGPVTTGGVNEVLQSIAMVGDEFVVVGHDATGPNYVAYYYDADGSATAGWNLLTGAFGATDALMDVAYTGANFVMVGKDAAGDGVSYSVVLATMDPGNDFTSTAAGSFLTGSSFGDALNAIDWSIAAGYGLVVGEKSTICEMDATGVNTSWIRPHFLTLEVYNFRDVKFDALAVGYGEALIAGGDGIDDAALLRYIDNTAGGGTTKNVANVTDSGGVLGFNPLYCVAFKPYASPRYATAFGDVGLAEGYQVCNVESFNNIYTNTKYPHIDFMDIYQDWTAMDTGTLVSNGKVDVDSTGTNTELVTVQLKCHHDSGWAEVTIIDLYIWWDNGQTLTNSQTITLAPKIGNPVDNSYAHFQFTNIGDVFAVVVAGQDEIKLVGGADVAWNTGPNLDGTLDHMVTFQFTFGKQAWTSSFNWGGLPVSNTGLDELGLDEANTWDVQATISGTGNGAETVTDELGVYVYQEFIGTGMPGEYTGSGPPNSEITLTTTANQAYASFSSNAPYQFGVYFEDDLYNSLFDDFINVDSYIAPGDDGVRVWGGDYNDLAPSTWYGAMDYAGAIWLIGAAGDGTAGVVDPNLQYDYTVCGNHAAVIAATQAKNGASVAEIGFICSVDATHGEDNYEGVITYILDY
ncbi:MAG: hypothetical protein KAT70_06290 [Thermoplasmata archaeon]|nr:hypothetical protein [Thermoplasmata archaeon]